MDTFYKKYKLSEQEPQATIMMVTFNRLDLTKRTIDSLKQNTNNIINLVIVDNKSSDETISYLNDLFKDEDLKRIVSSLVLIKNDQNLGIATARNQALYYSINELNTPYLSTIDNDVCFPKDWLNDCIIALNNNKSFGMVGVNFEPVTYPIIPINGCSIQYKKEGNLGTACTVFNRNLAKMLGFFNYKDYSPFYGLEGSDWGFRVRVLGLKLGYIVDNGIHLGEGLADIGDYREFKTKEHDTHKEKFFKICREYLSKTKPLFISFSTNLIEEKNAI